MASERTEGRRAMTQITGREARHAVSGVFPALVTPSCCHSALSGWMHRPPGPLIFSVAFFFFADAEYLLVI